jgi:hypothetical protein
MGFMQKSQKGSNHNMLWYSDSICMEIYGLYHMTLRFFFEKKTLFTGR